MSINPYNFPQYIKDQANAIRSSYIHNIEKHLLAFEQKLRNNKIEVLWVVDEDHLKDVIISLFPKQMYNKVCFDIPFSVQEINSFNNLIRHFTVDELINNNESVDFLVTKADFAVIESGKLFFINKKSQQSFNSVENLIILLDINKLLIKDQDAESIIYLQSLYKNGTFLPDGIKVLTTPYKRIIPQELYSTGEEQYSEESVKIYVLLYDNNISKILANEYSKESLLCIDCNKCKEVCPVYAVTKKYSPIDIIRQSGDNIQEKAKIIRQNCTFCGNCDAVCPVKISFTSMMIKQLENANNKHGFIALNNLYQRFSRRSKMNKMNHKFRRYFFLKNYYRKNKKLAQYFLSQEEDFFNVQWQNKEKREL